jgi:hypothetical protein
MAERDQLAVRDVRPDLPERPVDQFVDIPGALSFYRLTPELDRSHPASLIMLAHPVPRRLLADCIAVHHPGRIENGRAGNACANSRYP